MTRFRCQRHLPLIGNRVKFVRETCAELGIIGARRRFTTTAQAKVSFNNSTSSSITKILPKPARQLHRQATPGPSVPHTRSKTSASTSAVSTEPTTSVQAATSASGASITLNQNIIPKPKGEAGSGRPLSGGYTWETAMEELGWEKLEHSALKVSYCLLRVGLRLIRRRIPSPRCARYTSISIRSTTNRTSTIRRKLSMG